MASEEIAITSAIAVGGYIGTKLFGSALATMGDDINRLYVRGRDKIVEVASRKVEDHNDGKQVNIRAARDVLWNGAITEDDVCAEYFGGMLAAARSADGKDDSVVHYVDTVKAMSARQLELHYLIYKAWQSILVDKCQEMNVAQSSDVQTANLFFAGLELGARSIKYDRDLTVLHRLGLLFSFKYDNYVGEGKTLPYVQVSPTTFGVMLFAIAHNKLDSWRSYPQESYESAADIKPLSYSAETLDALCTFAGIQYAAE
jgi:hypothetical protein